MKPSRFRSAMSLSLRACLSPNPVLEPPPTSPLCVWTAGYWNTGKGSTWEGGIREAGFAHWPGVISPNSRSAEVVSSMDVFPTVMKLAGAKMPSDTPLSSRQTFPHYCQILLRPAAALRILTSEQLQKMARKRTRSCYSGRRFRALSDFSG